MKRYTAFLAIATLALCSLTGGYLRGSEPTIPLVTSSVSNVALTYGAPLMECDFYDANGKRWKRQNLHQHWPHMVSEEAPYFFVSDGPQGKSFGNEAFFSVGATDTSRAGSTDDGVKAVRVKAGGYDYRLGANVCLFLSSTQDSTEGVAAMGSALDTWEDDKEYIFYAKMSLGDCTTSWAVGLWGYNDFYGNTPSRTRGSPFKVPALDGETWNGRMSKTVQGLIFTRPGGTVIDSVSVFWQGASADSSRLKLDVNPDVTDDLLANGNTLTLAARIFGDDSCQVYVNGKTGSIVNGLSTTEALTLGMAMQDAGSPFFNQIAFLECWAATIPRR